MHFWEPFWHVPQTSPCGMMSIWRRVRTMLHIPCRSEVGWSFGEQSLPNPIIPMGLQPYDIASVGSLWKGQHALESAPPAFWLQGLYVWVSVPPRIKEDKRFLWELGHLDTSSYVEGSHFANNMETLLFSACVHTGLNASNVQATCFTHQTKVKAGWHHRTQIYKKI